MAIDRRSLLVRAAGASLGLPLFGVLSARAQTAAPRRFIVAYQTQGVLMEEWKPERTADGFRFGPLMRPLEPFRSNMLVLTGIHDTSCNLDGAAAHDRAPAHLLTGRRMVGRTWRDAGAASLDHVLADRISPAGIAFPSLHLGVTKPWEFSFRGARQPVDRMTQPADVFDRLFAGATATPDPEAARRRRQKKSVLDAIAGNGRALERRLGSEDRAVVGAYLDRIRGIEQRIDAVIGEGCTPVAPNLAPSPHRAGAARYDAALDHDVTSRLMIELGVLALACDRTRVLTLAWGQPNAYEHLPDARGQPIRTGDWHTDVVHVGGGTRARPTSQRDWLSRVQAWYHEELAHLLGRLEGTREGDGNLLEHSLLLYANELGNGATHGHDDKPYFLAGRLGGAVRPGRWVEAGGVPHNRLLLAILAAFGYSDAVFGERELSAGGPLGGVA